MADNAGMENFLILSCPRRLPLMYRVLFQLRRLHLRCLWPQAQTIQAERRKLIPLVELNCYRMFCQRSLILVGQHEQ